MNNVFLVVFHNMSTTQGKGEGDREEKERILEKKTRNEEKRIIEMIRSCVIREATAWSSNNANGIRTSYLYTYLSKKPIEQFPDIVI